MTDIKKNKSRLPEWAPQDAGSEFASRVISGGEVKSRRSQVVKKQIRPALDSAEIDKLYQGVISGNITVLSKAITLIESNSHKHFEPAQAIVQRLLPHCGNSVRIGITGVPGAGKSTFIETFGTWLIEQGHKVAVLAIDPSSSISKGSILGDKTRMEKLSRLKSSFIRPSPASGVLGGVARKTRETIIACEAAGFDVILIETVGVGQSEITVRSIVDFFLLMQITGAGDELQSIKKGIMELADLVVVNKADGANILRAETTRNELTQVLHYLQPATTGWQTTAITCSALNGVNIPGIWQLITEFMQLTKAGGVFEQRRNTQNLEWLNSMLTEALSQLFFNNKDLVESYNNSKQQILDGKLAPALAAANLIELFKTKF